MADVDRLRLVRMDCPEAEVSGQVAADLVPRVARIIAAHHVPVLLHEARRGRARCMAMRWTQWPTSWPGRGCSRGQAAIDRSPGPAAVVGAECARCRDGNIDPVGVGWIRQDGVQAKSARAGLPGRAGGVQARWTSRPRSCRRRWSGTAPRPRPPRRSCQDRSAMAPGARRLNSQGAGCRRGADAVAGNAVIDERIAHRRPRCAAIPSRADGSPVRTSRSTTGS